MPKRRPIRPFFSTKPWKNIHDHYDSKAHQWVKCAGFEIDVWEPLTQKRIRLKEKIGYKGAKALYQRWTELATMGRFEEIVHSQKVGVSSLTDLLEKWSREVSQPTYRREIPLSPETIRRTKVAVRGYQKAMKGSQGATVPVRDITPAQIEKYCQLRLAGGVSRAGINSDLGSLKALFNWGVFNNLLSENPFLAVKSFQTKKPEPRPLTKDELTRFFEACPPGARFHNLVMFYLLTGVRRSQAAKPNLKWSDIDFELGVIHLVRQKQKERSIPITPELEALLLDVRGNPIVKLTNQKPDDRLYPFPFSPSHITNKIFRPLFRAASIEGATLHDLRKTSLTVLVNELGYTTEAVKGYAGHSSIAVTEGYYLGKDIQQQREMGATLGAHLQSLAQSAARQAIGAETLSPGSKTVTQNSDKDVITPSSESNTSEQKDTPASSREAGADSVSSGGGTRTPDTRIMIPLL